MARFLLSQSYEKGKQTAEFQVTGKRDLWCAARESGKATRGDTGRRTEGGRACQRAAEGKRAPGGERLRGALAWLRISKSQSPPRFPRAALTPARGSGRPLMPARVWVMARALSAGCVMMTASLGSCEAYSEGSASGQRSRPVLRMCRSQTRPSPETSAQQLTRDQGQR